MKQTPILSVKNVTKEYRVGEVASLAVRDVSLDLHEKDFVAITGKSGSGKSTLLYQMGLLDYPTRGEVLMGQDDTATWSEKKRTKVRLATFGYVFQDYALVPELTAIENVAIPLYMTGKSYGQCAEAAKKLLTDVGLGERLRNRPSQLSGGEQQRVSIARALINSPKILFADEPTANLDSETSEKVMTIFDELHRDQGLTIVMVTHEKEYAKRASRVINLKDGSIVK